MLGYLQAIILGLVQGVSELFPISSLGHSVLLPPLAGWQIDQKDGAFLSFLVLTHLATALVLLGFFWRDWLNLLMGFFRSVRRGRLAPGDTQEKLIWLLIVSTVPAGLIGLALQKKIGLLFAAPAIVAIALALNGLVLYLTERMRKADEAEGEPDDRRLAALTWRQALLIGLAQCLALIPGFSRTGISMAGGLLTGLNHENALRYSFLMATPIILAAALLKVPGLFLQGAAGLGPALAGAVAAAISAFLAVKLLTRYFKNRTLMPFACYCTIGGILYLSWLVY